MSTLKEEIERYCLAIGDKVEAIKIGKLYRRNADTIYIEDTVPSNKLDKTLTWEDGSKYIDRPENECNPVWIWTRLYVYALSHDPNWGLIVIPRNPGDGRPPGYE